MESEINPWDIRPKTQDRATKRTAPLQVQLAKKLKLNFSKECLPQEKSPSKTTLSTNPSIDLEEKENVVNNLESSCFTYSAKRCLSTHSNTKPILKKVNSILPHQSSEVPIISTNLTNLTTPFEADTSIKANSVISDNKAGAFHEYVNYRSATRSHIPKPIPTKCGSLLSRPLVDGTSILDSDEFVTPINTAHGDSSNVTEVTSISKDLEIPSANSTTAADTNQTVPTDITVDTTFKKRTSNSMKSSRVNLPTHNYVKINLKKKQFCKKGSSKQRALKRQVYLSKLKKKFKNNSYQKKNTCYTCGATGHWSNKCPMTIMQSKTSTTANHSQYSQKYDVACKILNLNELDVRFCQPQLEDVFPADFLSNSSSSEISNPSVSIDELSRSIKSCLKQLGFDSFRAGQELVILRTLLGVSTLSVMPTASGKSLCYQIPAMIYQQLYKTVALVISPLISLMQDQVVQHMSGVQGAYLNSSLSADRKREILEEAQKGKYSFLMLSPEAIVESDWLLQSGRLPPISFVCIDEAHCLADWSNHFRPSYLRVCNLLRRYMKVKCFLGLSATCTPNVIKNICNNLGIINPIRLIGDQIDQSTLYQSGYVQPVITPLPSHLTISASMDARKDEALLKLLTNKPFSQLTGGVLIYCATREQTERLASFIRTALQDVVDKIGRKRMSWTTAAYHASQTTNERSRIQKKFMNGQIRVLIATCAFGMGLNKSDLQAVIHYSLTKSFENYIQEIGRVGRKQQSSYCHAFLPSSLMDDPSEANDIRRHIFVNHIDLVLLKRLLSLVFKDFRCVCRQTDDGSQTNDHTSSFSSASSSCQGHVHTVDLQAISEQVDIKPESLITILAYMELEPNNPIISILHSGYTIATVDCYGSQNEMAYASQRCLAIAGSLSLWRRNEQLQQKSKSCDDNTSCPRQLEINLPQLFNRWGWKPNVVKKELKNLEWDTTTSNDNDNNNNSITGQLNKTYRTGVSVNFSQWNLWLWIHGREVPITNERLDACLMYLNNRLQQTEKTALQSIEQLTLTLGTVVQPSIEDVYPIENINNNINVDILFKDKSKPVLEESDLNENCKQRSLVVHELIKSHFSDTEPILSEEMLVMLKNCQSQYHWPPEITDSQVAQVQSTVRDFLRVHESSLNTTITGRVLANIFHGISTPQFPATTWSRCHRFWKAHMNIDWPSIKRIATQELLIHYTWT
ncbi:unnamed protein product [Trichobilharzia szidati]|nr:unnamed protein product [Trichobilharzia szidati]